MESVPHIVKENRWLKGSTAGYSFSCSGRKVRLVRKKMMCYGYAYSEADVFRNEKDGTVTTKRRRRDKYESSGYAL